MIDYEKLKEAHELCRKYSTQVKVAHHITVLFYAYDKPFNYGLHKYYDEFHEQYTDIDMLIATLKELTNPEPKYHDLQLVWFIDKWNQFTSRFVMRSWQSTDISTSERYWVYDLSMDRPLFESQLFPTRQALIEHQLQYWSKLFQDECKHPNKYLQQDGKYDCDDCGSVGMHMSPVYEGEIKGFGYDVRKHVSPYCEPVEKVEQSQYVPDCEHEPDGREHCFNDSGGHFKMSKCIKCGEFYR